MTALANSTHGHEDYITNFTIHDKGTKHLPPIENEDGTLTRVGWHVFQPFPGTLEVYRAQALEVFGHEVAPEVPAMDWHKDEFTRMALEQWRNGGNAPGPNEPLIITANDVDLEDELAHIRAMLDHPEWCEGECWDGNTAGDVEHQGQIVPVEVDLGGDFVTARVMPYMYCDTLALDEDDEVEALVSITMPSEWTYMTPDQLEELGRGLIEQAQRVRALGRR